MRKFFTTFFLYLITLLCCSYNAAATVTTISTGTTYLSNLIGSSPYALQFTGQQNQAEFVVDTSGKTITSIDLNAASTTGIVIDPGLNLSLGSVYDQQAVVGIGAETAITIGNNSTLTLTGDNYWTTVGNSANFAPSSFYYEDNGGAGFLSIDSFGQAITAENPSALQAYLWIQLYAGGIPHSVDSTYTGPYNLYSGVSSITLNAGANLIVDTTQSSSGNNTTFTTNNFLYNNSPTILTNAFSFADSSAILTINTPLIATHPSIGNFGHITANMNSNGAAAPALVINAPGELTTISSIWDNHVAPLFTLSDTDITDPSIGGNTIYIGTDTSLYSSSPTLSIKPSALTWTTNNPASNFPYNGLGVSNVYPLGNSTLVLDSSSTGRGSRVHFFSPDTGIGGYAAGPYPAALDLAGNVILSTGGGATLTLDSGTATGASNGQFGSLGFYDLGNTGIIARLQSLTIQGTEQIDVIMPVYSQSITFSSAAPINLVQPDWVSQNSIPPSTMGDGAAITLLHDVVPDSSITISGGDPTLQSTGVTINLGTFTFNTGSATIYTGDNTTQGFTSSLRFIGDVVINTLFIANNQLTGGNGGNFVVGNGSSLDLSGAGYNSPTSVSVQLTADGSVPANGEFSYYLFQGGGQIILPQAPVNFGYSITNPHPLLPMTWEYDQDTYIISSNTDRSRAVNIVQSSGGSTGAVVIINNLVTSQGGSTSINALQATALNNINADTLNETLSNLEQLVLSTEADDAIASVVAMHESEAQASVLVNVDSLMFTEEESIISGEGVAAGNNIDDDIKHQQGAWVSGFTQKAKQKSGNSIPGYKVTSYGGTLGFDSGFTDNLILGLAWSTADSKLKRTDLRGNRSRIKTNLFSIYGLVSIPHNWLIQSSISGGFSKIESRSVRHAGTNLTIAVGKHNANYFGADIHLLKRLSLGKSSIIAEPDIGLNMSQFNDKSYKESGGATNWKIGKRQSYNIEAIIGGKILASYKTASDWLLKPYLSAYSHITLKDKRGKIHTSLDSNMNGLYLTPQKASKAWYSGGAGLFLYKGALEISAAWELQHDKGYVSNQGSVKFRLEF